MAINFNTLPKDNPFSVPDSGYYKFKIIKAEMKTPGEQAKNQKPYLNMTLALINAAGVKAGNIFDALRDSDQQVQLFKLGRFTEAIGLHLTGNVELRDLAKLVVNKEGITEIENSEDFRDKDKPVHDRRRQAQVKIFGSDAYWPLTEWDALVPDAAAAVADDGPAPWDEEFTGEDAIVPTLTPPAPAADTADQY